MSKTIVNINLHGDLADLFSERFDRIMTTLQELNDKVDAQTAALADQSAALAATRAYVSGIETAVRDLQNGTVLSAEVQTKVDAIVAAIDANAAALAANTAGVVATGDGDLAT